MTSNVEITIPREKSDLIIEGRIHYPLDSDANHFLVIDAISAMSDEGEVTFTAEDMVFIGENTEMIFELIEAAEQDRIEKFLNGQP